MAAPASTNGKNAATTAIGAPTSTWCALFSALHGWWNEPLTSDGGFVTALKHLVKANILAMRAILQVRPDALFVQSESTEYFHAENPAAIDPAEIRNSRRFLSLVLNYDRRVDSEMYEYLFDNGMRRDEYHFFLNNNIKHHCIMGNDYYQANEHYVAANGKTRASGEVFGYAVITHQYYNRYRLPVMHTETNLCVNPLGLYDLERNIRPVGIAYKKLINAWIAVLPTQSVCLPVPIAMPRDYRPDCVVPAPVPANADANSATNAPRNAQ